MKEKRKLRTSTEVKTRYNKKMYSSISIRIPKKIAEAFRDKCAETGISQAKILKEAINNFLDEVNI